VVGFVVTVALAASGAGYWSLVAGVVAGRMAGAIVAVRYSPYRPGWRFERDKVREYVRFSGPLFFASASRVVGVQALIFAGEAELGLAGVGVITLASGIRMYSDKVDSIITQTLYPAVCAVRDRPDLLREAFTKSNRLGLVWGIPFGVGLALFAEDLVQYVLGDEWRPAVGLLQAFGLLAAMNHIGYNWSAFFRARGDTRPLAVSGAFGVASMLFVVIPMLFAWELKGLAAGIAVSGVIALGVRWWYLTRLFPGFPVLRHSARAIAPTIPSALAVLGLRAALDVERTGALALAELGLFVALTAVFTALLERPLLREVRAYLRPAPAG
jgi:O-antigen/teichoic acid export membrane protein